MSIFDKVTSNLPEVKGPEQRRLSFKEKLKWTLIILVLFFVMGMIPLFGLGANALEQFEYLSLILGAKFGSIISLGIGPIVTASIVLQLLSGSGILKMDMTSHEGKKKFQGLQKLLALFFIIFEAGVYVFMGGLAPPSAFAGTGMYFQLQMVLVFQLFLGGLMILFMDEVISKWGFGSGVSLFIAAGVSEQLFIRLFSPLAQYKGGVALGAIPALFQSISMGDPVLAGLMLAGIVSTVFVFMISIYGQAMKIEIPLSFGRIRGHGIRWPLNFIYTSNIPVILIAALLANIQLVARLLQSKGIMWLGEFSGNVPVKGLVLWLNSPDIVSKLIRGNFVVADLMHGAVFLLIMIGGSVMFSIFWMQTARMDAKSQAEQIMASGLQIPGFRKDQRILERLLNRYIWPLTIMGAVVVGFLAGIADLTGALSRGTGILLTVMIVYKLYEEIAKQHMMDMHPLMRRMME
ncbi:preprotein translocase subunit SecY [Candidatus Woesearchaeota archaeon]|nr:preprotein translocase subunit SecY [Candidatus Woesearchaeota archaeon]